MIRGPIAAVESLLRNPRRVLYQLRQPGAGHVIVALLLIAVTCSLVYGVVVGTFSMGAQLWIQVKSVLFTIVWSGVVSFVAYKIADLLVGLRVSEEDERQGLDISSHGESAYSR